MSLISRIAEKVGSIFANGNMSPVSIRLEYTGIERIWYTYQHCYIRNDISLLIINKPIACDNILGLAALMSSHFTTSQPIRAGLFSMSLVIHLLRKNKAHPDYLHTVLPYCVHQY